MSRSPRAAPLDRVKLALREILGLKADLIQRKSNSQNADMLLNAPDVEFPVEWKAVGDAANVGSAVRQLSPLKKDKKGRSKAVVPIVAVPFMGETGRRLSAEAGISWIDLSGNAWIDAPGRHIRILGHPNRFASKGRPANVFAPKSSRIVRALLMAPEREFTQGELVEASGVDKGRVSRLFRRLERTGLVARADSGAIRLKEPSLALEAWREAYDFEKHDILRGHVGVRSSDELIGRLSAKLQSTRGGYALTGLAGAWYLTRFAGFRLTTVFTSEVPSKKWLEAIGFKEQPRGANLWLVRPVDDGVFVGMRVIDGVSTAHPIQVYLDLKAHPERASEAAAEVRSRLLNWSGA